uniref:Uncharacterized protein n=1 Tax=Schistosoma japonicum TaxID=6182 RepID=Q5C6D5_SCHJA|nr:unknown [Schistosoma japonicum]
MVLMPVEGIALLLIRLGESSIALVSAVGVAFLGENGPLCMILLLFIPSAETS